MLYAVFICALTYAPGGVIGRDVPTTACTIMTNPAFVGMTDRAACVGFADVLNRESGMVSSISWEERVAEQQWGWHECRPEDGG